MLHLSDAHIACHQIDASWLACAKVAPVLIGWLSNHLCTRVPASTPVFFLWDVDVVHVMASKRYTGLKASLFITCDVSLQTATLCLQ